MLVLWVCGPQKRFANCQTAVPLILLAGEAEDAATTAAVRLQDRGKPLIGANMLIARYPALVKRSLTSMARAIALLDTSDKLLKGCWLRVAVLVNPELILYRGERV